MLTCTFGCQDEYDFNPIEGDVIVDFSEWEEGSNFVGVGYSNFRILASDFQILSVKRWDTDENAVGLEIMDQGLILDWNKLDLNFSKIEIEYYLQNGAAVDVDFLDKKDHEKQSHQLSDNDGMLQTASILIGQDVHYTQIRSLVIYSQGMLIKKVSLRRPGLNL
jgi:hypothetical protein